MGFQQERKSYCLCWAATRHRCEDSYKLNTKNSVLYLQNFTTSVKVLKRLGFQIDDKRIDAILKKKKKKQKAEEEEEEEAWAWRARSCSRSSSQWGPQYRRALPVAKPFDPAVVCCSVLSVDILLPYFKSPVTQSFANIHAHVDSCNNQQQQQLL